MRSYEIVSMLLSCLSGLIYIYFVFMKKVRPSLAAQVVFLLSMVTILSSSNDLGGSSAMVPGLANIAMVLLTMGIMFWKRMGHRNFSRLNQYSIGLCIIGVIVWKVLNTPEVSLIISVAIDAIGISTVIVKMLKDSGSESIWSWSLTTLGYSVPLLFTKNHNWSNLVFSYSSILLCGTVSCIALWQRLQSDQKFCHAVIEKPGL